MGKRRGLVVFGAVVALVLALPVGWYLASPLFITRTVDEPLPTAMPGVVATVAAPAASVPAATVIMVTEVLAEATATEAPANESAIMAAMETEAMATAQAAPTRVVPTPVPTEAPPTPEVLAQGQFYNVVHNGAGQATVLRLADGARVLRFEDFSVLNGPELHVYLVPIDPVPYSGGVEIAGAVDLGLLKGNAGSQNYDLPAELDLSQFKSVVIWCQPFRVPFAAAPLTVP